MRKRARSLAAESCVIALVAAFLAVTETNMPGPVAIAIGVALICGPGLFVMVHTHSPGIFGAICLWAVFLAAWVVYARHDGHPWTWRVAAALVVPGLVLTCVLVAAVSEWAKQAEQHDTVIKRKLDDEKLAAWGKKLGRCGIKRVRAVAEERARGGVNVTLELPDDGTVTINTLESVAENLAAGLRLRRGSVTFTAGEHAGLVVMHLDEADVMAEALPFPMEIKTLSINDPLRFGVYPDGSWLEELLGDFNVFIAGTTGAGKSNLLNVLIAILTMCEDVVVWVIDTKGRLVAPWILPWVEGRDGVEAPALDWIATTRGEAYLMLDQLLRIIRMRSLSLVGGSAMTASREHPAIVVITDEMGDLTARGEPEEGPAPAKFQQLLSEIARKIRSEACKLILASQRGTTDLTGVTAIKAMCRFRFSLPVADQAEARGISEIPAVQRLIALAEHPGSVVIERPGRRDPIMAKLFRLDTKNRDDLAKLDHFAEVAGRDRPGPGDDAEALMGEVYAGRWARCDLYQRMMAEHHEATGKAPLPPDPAKDVEQQLATLDVSTEFEALMTGGVVDKATGKLVGEMGLGPGRDSGGPKGRYWALLSEATQQMPTLGASAVQVVGKLVAEFGGDESTYYRWLRDDAKAGRLRRVGDPDDQRRARYVVVAAPGNASESGEAG